jgi:hypothetical protein
MNELRGTQILSKFRKTVISRDDSGHTKNSVVIESRLEGVNRRNVKFINFKHTLGPGLALELNSSPKECFSC